MSWERERARRYLLGHRLYHLTMALEFEEMIDPEVINACRSEEDYRYWLGRLLAPEGVEHFAGRAKTACTTCAGVGRTDNHVTGEVECSGCAGKGSTWDALAAARDLRNLVDIHRGAAQDLRDNLDDWAGSEEEFRLGLLQCIGDPEEWVNMAAENILAGVDSDEFEGVNP